MLFDVDAENSAALRFVNADMGMIRRKRLHL